MRGRMLALGGALVMIGLLAGADAARPLSLGISDGWIRADASRQELLGEAKAAGARIAYYTVNWRSVAPISPRPSFAAADPADPEYDWSGVDEFVRAAGEQGFRVAFLVHSAPDWAEGPGRPPRAPAGTWKPRPAALAAFTSALATRYSGTFVDPASPAGGPLPRVGYYQAWAEANLSTRLSPQWSGARRNGKPRPLSPRIYRRMLNAFYGAIKQVDPSMSVITTGTAPYGDAPGGRRMRPLKFWREVLCLRGRGPRPTACPQKARFDIFAHHPINTSGRPTREPFDSDDISSANLDVLVDALRVAERGKRTKPAGRHPVWVTEFWYRSDPPEQELGLPPQKQARYIAESLYLFWKAGAEAAVNLLIRDREGPYDSPIDPAGAGLYYADGTAKPAFRAFRFPFVAERLDRREVRIWGRAPSQGRVTIQARGRGGTWRDLYGLRAGESQIFTARRRIVGRAVLRAELNGEPSRSWIVARRTSRRSPRDSSLSSVPPRPRAGNHPAYAAPDREAVRLGPPE